MKPTQILQKYSAGEIISLLDAPIGSPQATDKTNLAIAIIQRSQQLSIASIIQQPNNRIFQAKDKAHTLKQLCAIIAMYNASITITTDRMNAIAIYEFATYIITNHPTESVQDLMLCFQLAKQGQFGKIYNRIDIAICHEFWNKYLAHKAEAIEYHHINKKEEYSRTVADIDYRKLIETHTQTRQQELKALKAANDNRT